FSIAVIEAGFEPVLTRANATSRPLLVCTLGIRKLERSGRLAAIPMREYKTLVVPSRTSKNVETLTVPVVVNFPHSISPGEGVLGGDVPPLITRTRPAGSVMAAIFPVNNSCP